MSTVTAAQRAAEYAAIHLSACRYRAQGLVCSTCCELVEWADRLAARAAVVVAAAA